MPKQWVHMQHGLPDDAIQRMTLGAMREGMLNADNLVYDHDTDKWYDVYGREVNESLVW